MRKPQQWNEWLGAGAAVLFAAGVLLFLGVAMQLWLPAWLQGILNFLLAVALVTGLALMLLERGARGLASGIAFLLGFILASLGGIPILGQLAAMGYTAFW